MDLIKLGKEAESHYAASKETFWVGLLAAAGFIKLL